MKIDVAIKQWKNSSVYALLKSKELLIVLYFLVFIFGIAYGSGYKFYNGYRILQVALLFTLGFWALYQRQLIVSKVELLFFAFIALGSLFWDNALFIVTDLLLAYLLYKGFQALTYNALITKAVVLGSFVLFLMLPVGLFDYINSGLYRSDWYPLAWNIRIYNSYLFILSIFATWFYISTVKYRNIYLVFLFLALLAILLDAGRSAALAYTVFMVMVGVCNRQVWRPLLAVYALAFCTYVGVSYAASLSVDSASSALQIARTTTSLRYDLWLHALECWLQSPLVGCGFYQLGHYEQFAAHPHNLVLQVLSETGLIGFGFLAFILFSILRHINWRAQNSYFVLAALVAIGVDSSLSGVYIYPITQLALLWLLVFLLKNPEFAHAAHFTQLQHNTSTSNRYLSAAVMLILAVMFCYLVINTSIFLTDMPSTPPRFWGYGYHLL